MPSMLTVSVPSSDRAYFLVSSAGSGRGVVHVLDAFCPHLGANLGHEGKVDGNSIECPFHGWQFDPNGVCNKIPYASKIPNTAKTGVWSVQGRHGTLDTQPGCRAAAHSVCESPVPLLLCCRECCEVNGSVFLWYDVDRRKPSWSIPSLSSGAAPTNGGSFHGRIKRHIPGNVLEVMTKQADAWSGDLISQAPTSVSPPSVCGFAWRWSRGKSEWVLSAESPNEATLTTSAQLTFLGRVVPFASFTVTLRHIGPSLVYATFQPASVVGRTLLGDVLLTQTCRPDSAFLNSVEWTVNTRPLLGAGAIATAAHLVSLPVRRAVAKLMLRLVDAEFAARILPIYTLRTRRLGLHNSAGARDAFAALDEEEENASEAAEAAAATDRVSPTAKLSSRAAVSPVSSSAAAASASRPRTSVKGYSTTSHFAVAFWRTFYSDSAAKKQDDLTW